MPFLFLRPYSSILRPIPRDSWIVWGAFLLLIVSGARCLAAPDASKEMGLRLAHDGKAAMPIIISSKATEGVKAVAGELAEYLHRITGAAFEVRAGDGAEGIVLGTLAEFPNSELKKPLEIRNHFDGKEAYAIRTEPKRLLLVGAADLGASHAAYRFLEILGCRWFFPSREWEIVPATSNLSFNQNETDRPVIPSRNIWYGGGLIRDPSNPEDGVRSKSEYEAWRRHNRMASSLTVKAGHSWQAIIARNQAEFDKHPEYYALVKGQRKPRNAASAKFEVAHPAVRKMAVDYALDHFRKNPDADMVSMEPSDGGGQSESEESEELGNFSDQVFGLANEVARAVQKEFPGKMVGLLAYGWHSDPPANFDLEPNVFVARTAGYTHSKHSREELWDLWSKKCRNLGAYEYFSVWVWDYDRLPGGRAADISYLQKMIPFYASHNVLSLNAESSNNWGPHGRGYYIANKLMWNPQADVPALLDDFYKKAFGSAATVMQRYYERLDAGNEPLLSKTLLALAFRDLDEASRLARDRPDVQSRLDHLKQYLYFNYLYWKLDRATEKKERKPMALALLTHSYRTRFSYMTHWEVARQLWTGRVAKEFDEPSWKAQAPGPEKPWKVQTPLTHEETENNFQEGLAYFQPQIVTEQTFSSDLVPVRFENSPSIASSQGYQGGPIYVLYSKTGEPLQVGIKTGMIAIYRDRPDAHYALTDSNRTVVVQGALPLDGETHPMEFKVPGPGLYHLDVNDSGAAWNISAAPDISICIELTRDRRLSALSTIQDMYFYVPKGVKQVEYYWSGKPHHVIAPDETDREVNTTQEFAIIPVPKGQDGKVWRLSGLNPRQLLFFNIPNYIAASPNALLVPREVARADGLKIPDSQTEKNDIKNVLF
ncbi:MAG: DUF4838 domain-containing protein [Verrucomicrobia bacterium]|nr:DUF4838 domain-containing protein [Verrucomicrobiota bacterium]